MNKQVKTLMCKVLSKLIDLNQSEHADCWYSVAGHVDGLDIKIETPKLLIVGYCSDFYYDKNLSDDDNSIYMLEDALLNIERIKREVEVKTSPEFLEEEKIKRVESRKAQLLKELKELEG